MDKYRHILPRPFRRTFSIQQIRIPFFKRCRFRLARTIDIYILSDDPRFFSCPSIYIDMYLNPALYIAPENYFFHTYLFLQVRRQFLPMQTQGAPSLRLYLPAKSSKQTYEPDAISGCSKYLFFQKKRHIIVFL